MHYQEDIYHCSENDVNHKMFQRKSSLMPTDYMPLFDNRPIENGTCFSENASIASLKTHVKVPSFEFHVSSEAGITLHVDLNSSPLDWTWRFHNEVFVCENMHKNKCHLPPKDLGFPTKGSEEMINSLSNDHTQISCLNSEIVSSDRVGLKQSDKIDGSLMFSKSTSCSLTFDLSEPTKEDEALVSTENRSGAHKLKPSNSESSTQNKEHAFLDLNSDDILQSKANHVIAIPSCSSVSAKLKHQNSIIGGESFDFPSLQNCSSDFDILVESPGFVENSSVKMQLLEVSSFHMDESCSPSETGGTLNLVNFEDAGERQERCHNSRDSTNASRLGVHPWMKEREKMDIVSMLKVSESVQLSNLMKKTVVGDENLESEKEHKKRKRVEDISRTHYLKSHARILRSTKHIVNSPRRSKRLISKVALFAIFVELFEERY